MRNHYRMLSTDELVEAGLYGPDNTSLTIVLAERLQDGYDTMDLGAENEELQRENADLLDQIRNLYKSIEESDLEIELLNCEKMNLQEQLGIYEDDDQ